MATSRSVDAGVGIGEIFLEKYRVDAILGHGGMGVVARCTHLALNERVAIKMLRRDVLDDADAVERFMREAQAASKLRSEYVARVTDVGRSTKNVPYMVMEYLEGHDLGQLLEQRGHLAVPWAVELTLQACEALAEAHSIGIVHRDVKPSNLFVTWRPDGSALVKVLDFGISKSPTGSAMQLTQTQSLLGTPAYMSPEQMRSARMVDARTDIWSLGTVLYEILEGRRPFEAESFSEMCVKVAIDPPAPMRRAPRELQPVVLRCLEKLPEQRYASMAELGRDLVAFAHDRHQANVLVQRMARTLRRNQVGDWDDHAALDRRSAERSAELAAELSSHSLPALPAAAAPVVAVARVTAAAPVPAGGHETTFAVARPLRRRRALTAFAAVAAAGLGVALSLARPAATPAPTTAPAALPIAGAPAVPAVASPPPAAVAAAPHTPAVTPTAAPATEEPPVAAPASNEPPIATAAGGSVHDVAPRKRPRVPTRAPTGKSARPCAASDPFAAPHATPGTAPCPPAHNGAGT